VRTQQRSRGRRRRRGVCKWGATTTARAAINKKLKGKRWGNGKLVDWQTGDKRWEKMKTGTKKQKSKKRQKKACCLVASAKLPQTMASPQVLLAAALSISLLAVTLPRASSARGLLLPSGVGGSGSGGGGGDDNKEDVVAPPEAEATTTSGHPLSLHFPHPHHAVAPSSGGGNTTTNTPEAAEIRRLFAGKVAPNLLASFFLVLTAGTMAGLTVVGLCTLNQVDPYPITYSLSNP
jgi:hypothetical protein